MLRRIRAAGRGRAVAFAFLGTLVSGACASGVAVDPPAPIVPSPAGDPAHEREAAPGGASSAPSREGPSPSPAQAPAPPEPERAGPAAPVPGVGVLAARTTRIVDGDTAHFRLAEGRTEKVRFIGMDTPESGRPYFAESTRYASERLAGKDVFLEMDVEERDRYGRLLAYVWLARPGARSPEEISSQMFNAMALRDGFARTATYPPNVRYVDLFRRLQDEARIEERGLWSPAGEGAYGTAAPAAAPPAAAAAAGGCHPSYSGACLPADASDVDCAGGGGNGPVYAQEKNFAVVGPDDYGLDRDGNGFACER